MNNLPEPKNRFPVSPRKLLLYHRNFTFNLKYIQPAAYSHTHVHTDCHSTNRVLVYGKSVGREVS